MRYDDFRRSDDIEDRRDDSGGGFGGGGGLGLPMGGGGLFCERSNQRDTSKY